jgi:hypothetical protein
VFLQSNFSRLLGVYCTSPESFGDEYTGPSHGGDTTGDLGLHAGEYIDRSRLLCNEYIGMLITKTNNAWDIRQKSKSWLGMSNWTRRNCLMKTPRRKISWHSPFKKLTPPPPPQTLLLFPKVWPLSYIPTSHISCQEVPASPIPNSLMSPARRFPYPLPLILFCTYPARRFPCPTSLTLLFLMLWVFLILRP